jgi:predicted O-methyltransferase YrrM
MSEFYEVLKLEWGPAQYEIRPMPIQYDNNSPNIENWYMGMKGYDFPRSIYVHEFDYLKNLVIDYNLKSGYEVATAFGLSALALGLGFKETGGKLVTMDAYIEESQIEIEDYIIRYRNEGSNTVTDAMGYKSANYLMEYFRLKDVVKVEIGYSPIDVGRILGKNIDKKLDFAFIDAGHFPEQVIKDLQAIIPFLGDEYVIALHDCFPYMITPEVEEFIRKSFGKDIALAVTWPYGYNLGVIINKKKPVTQV